MPGKHALVCHMCFDKLTEPGRGWYDVANFSPRMRAGDLSVVDDINRAYSVAVVETNADHFQAKHTAYYQLFLTRGGQENA